MNLSFRGVDPYVESQGFCPDFHARFINYWCEAIAELLPSGYRAQIAERVNLIELPAEKIKSIKPDVSITREAGHRPARRPPPGVAVIEPVTVPLSIEDETRETYIEIVHRDDHALVAVLELLSPANKEEPGRALYLAKRDALIHQPVHLVEIDLLLSGRRPPLRGDYPAGECFALVSRSDQRPNCDVFAWPLRNPLPPVPVPLHSVDGDIWIDMNAVIHEVYRKGRYKDEIDYAAPINLPNA